MPPNLMPSVFKFRAAQILLPAIIIFAAIGACAIGQPAADLKSLYEGHHWFQLRDALIATKGSALFQGAVAAAFNKREDAEKILLGVIAAAPRSKDAAAAREFLIHLYLRSSQYSEAIPLMAESVPASTPDGQAIFAEFVQLGDQSVISRGASTLHYE